MIQLSRADVDDLLYVLDDADRLFYHSCGDNLLQLWRRLHLERCEADEVRRGRPRLHYEITRVEALQIRLAVNRTWLASIRPRDRRERMRELLDRLRPARVA